MDGTADALSKMAATPPSTAPSVGAGSIDDAAVVTAMRVSGYMNPVDLLCLGATCKSLTRFSSDQIHLARTLLQKAGSLLQAEQPWEHCQPFELAHVKTHSHRLLRIAKWIDLAGCDQLVAAVLFHTPHVPLEAAAVLVAAGLWAGGPQLVAAADRGVAGYQVWYIAQQWLMTVHTLQTIEGLPLLQDYLESGPFSWVSSPGRDLLKPMVDEVAQLSPQELESILYLVISLDCQPSFHSGNSRGAWRTPSTAFGHVIGAMRGPSYGQSALSKLDLEAAARLLHAVVSVACAPHLYQPKPEDLNEHPCTITTLEGHALQLNKGIDDMKLCYSRFVLALMWLPVVRHMNDYLFEGIWAALAQGLDELELLEDTNRPFSTNGPCTWRRWQYIGSLCMLSNHSGSMAVRNQPAVLTSILKYKLRNGSPMDVIHIQHLLQKAIAAGTMQRLTNNQLRSLADAASSAYMPSYDRELPAHVYSVKGLRALLWYARVRLAAEQSVKHQSPPKIVVEFCGRMLAAGLGCHVIDWQVKELCHMLHDEFVAPLLLQPGWKGWLLRRVVCDCGVCGRWVSLSDLRALARLCCWLKGIWID